MKESDARAVSAMAAVMTWSCRQSFSSVVPNISPQYAATLNMLCCMNKPPLSPDEVSWKVHVDHVKVKAALKLI